MLDKFRIFDEEIFVNAHFLYMDLDQDQDEDKDWKMDFTSTYVLFNQIVLKPLIVLFEVNINRKR